ncbi:hypothetical protein L6R52_38525 [Myxococcota bacterium]|nr:hypothetical protein [Myxococcota bacterium]
MRVDGQQSFLFEFLGWDETKEATVKRKSEGFSIEDLFSGKAPERYTEIDTGRGDDTVFVEKTGPDEYTVTVNGEELTLTREEMKNLHLKTGSGNDRIIIDPSVDIPLNVDSGGGDDVIVNHASGVKIDAGFGDDHVVSTGDACEIVTGYGDDYVAIYGDGNRVTDGELDPLLELLGVDHGDDELHDFGRGNDIPDYWSRKKREELEG